MTTNWQTTPGEARTLAKVVQLVRNRCGGPEWSLAGIEDVLLKARVLGPFPDLIHAAVEAARDPANRTPAVIGMEGPHWRVAQVAPTFKPPDPWTLCHDCGKTERDCALKQQGAPPEERHRFRSRGSVANQPQRELSAKQRAIEEAKAATARRQGLVCPHGVRPDVRCLDCDTAPAVEVEAVATP